MDRRVGGRTTTTTNNNSHVIDWEPRNAWNELHQCASRGDLQGVQRLIQKALHDEDKYELKSNKKQTQRLEIATKNGDRAIHLALRGGYVDVFRELLRCGADPHARGHGGETAFLICAKNGLITEMELLLDALGTEVLSETTDSGMTAVHLAALQDRSDTLRFLKSRNASLHVLDNDQNTPLHLAARVGAVGAIRWLVDQDETLLRAENKLKQTPERVARNSQRVEAVGALWAAQEAVSERRKVPAAFLKLASAGELASLKTLYQTWGVTIHDIADWRSPKTGSNATLEACANGRLNVLKFLFSLPGKRDLMNEKTGHGALMLAAVRGHGHICAYLVDDKGMDPSSGTDATGRTPAQAAREANRIDVATYLEAKESKLRDRPTTTTTATAAGGGGGGGLPRMTTGGGGGGGGGTSSSMDDLMRMISVTPSNSSGQTGMTRESSGDGSLGSSAVINKNKDLLALLQRFDLSQYFPKLIEEGFDTPSHLMHVMESDLVRWGMKPGHRRSLLDCVEQLRSSSTTLALTGGTGTGTGTGGTATGGTSTGVSFPIARASSAPTLTTPSTPMRNDNTPVPPASSSSRFPSKLGNEDDGNGFVKIIDAKELELEERVLGEGSFGIVRVATWRGSKVAVKALKLRVTMKVSPAGGGGGGGGDTDDSAGIPSDVERDLRNEALVMQRVCNHANIIPFVGFVLTPIPSVVTALMPFGSVEALLVSPGWVRNTLEGWGVLWSIAIKFARDAAAGMLHLHAERVIHRDFSARNLLVDAQGNVRVADFGFARVKDSNSSKGYSKQSVGPLLWMSPEAIRRKVFSEKSDVFSFGVTLWEILVGSPPWEGQDTMDVVFRVWNGERLPLPVLAPIPRDVLILLEDSWKQDPTARPSSKVVLDRMELALSAMPVVAPFPILYERAVSTEFDHGLSGGGETTKMIVNVGGSGGSHGVDDDDDPVQTPHDGEDASNRYVEF